ncbi:hypothetical protein [Gordonia lacunae]|uniref:hypothetical protein n=1 Tax=Gordonia lacunae TaxID=417102 RepID=UPI00117A7852|nr:hypothetical protein [Gordonia lacunae]
MSEHGRTRTEQGRVRSVAWVRVAWIVVAALGCAFAVWNAFEPAGWSSMSCGKFGELDEPGVRAGATCDDPVWFAYGAWPLVTLGALLSAPAVVAALMMRWWVSWLAVAALAALTVYGVAHWTGFWGLLMVGGAPMTVAAIVIAGIHLGVTAYNDSRHAVA